MANNDLKISELPLISGSQIDGGEILPFAKGNANGGLLVSLLSVFIREGLATQSSVNWKQDKLEPGYGIEITDQNEIRTTLDVSPFEIVEVLPTSDIKNKIYCVPDPDGEVGKNEYVEYLWIEDHWEVVGKFAPKVDLTPYLKTSDAESTYAKKNEIPDITPLATKEELNAITTLLNQLQQTVQSMKAIVDTIPATPSNDGKTYGIKDRTWEPIADAGEAVATVNATQEQEPASE